jgi:hypothetical protein
MGDPYVLAKGSALPGLIILFMLGIFYFIPTIIAHNKNHRNFNAILILNIVLGWTLLGWIVALIWAVIKPRTSLTED